MPNPALKALQSQFDEKVQQAEVLSTKADVTAEEVAQYKTLVAEANSLKTQIEELTAADGNLNSLKSWNSEPANPLPQSGQGQSAGRVQGFKAAGSAEIGQEDGESVLHNIGAGV